MTLYLVVYLFSFLKSGRKDKGYSSKKQIFTGLIFTNEGRRRKAVEKNIALEFIFLIFYW